MGTGDVIDKQLPEYVEGENKWKKGKGTRAQQIIEGTQRGVGGSGL